MSYGLSKYALNQLQGIIDDYAERGSDERGNQIAHAILDTIDLLVTQPLMGRTEKNLTFQKETVRSFTHPPHYRIYYIFDGTDIYVVSIFDVRQHPKKLRLR